MKIISVIAYYIMYVFTLLFPQVYIFLSLKSFSSINLLYISDMLINSSLCFMLSYIFYFIKNKAVKSLGSKDFLFSEYWTNYKLLNFIKFSELLQKALYAFVIMIPIDLLKYSEQNEMIYLLMFVPSIIIGIKFLNKINKRERIY